METKKLNFIIEHFGCTTPIDGNDVLTSLGNKSRASIEDFWNTFSGDAEKYFEIIPTGEKKELSLTLDKRIRRHIEQELGLGLK